ncbi:prepilin-type N-terminal cleavage/methylation domain-containing protein [Pusillimonas sp. MFBS29]|uniref:prepilin-type N-terminal cleavage/methylation domain-containing protein n=1 Tax=Pusillimonas sp. MFBS29 TaxID=2886690 RepID=UPI001D11130D|nr:prepilin-type N-terminal cleavage/methylation domain-containing protein [Pusillimonas sp. MFBS29]MCC2595584.1 prepilin-type N-terminal cleavage/methylation domain-containing protein [Pusillimonas sp. MFBS29]
MVNPASQPGLARQQGFTLIEVLIVLLIIGIATTTISVAAFSDTDSLALRKDGQRLAQLFTLAQSEARRAGSPVIWLHDQQGYRFVQAPRKLFLPAGMNREQGLLQATDFPDSSPLRPRDWTPDNAIEVSVHPQGAAEFNTEWISGPQVVELHDGTHTVRLVRQGNGQYEALP